MASSGQQSRRGSRDVPLNIAICIDMEPKFGPVLLPLTIETPPMQLRFLKILGDVLEACRHGAVCRESDRISFKQAVDKARTISANSVFNSKIRRGFTAPTGPRLAPTELQERQDHKMPPPRTKSLHGPARMLTQMGGNIEMNPIAESSEEDSLELSNEKPVRAVTCGHLAPPEDKQVHRPRSLGDLRAFDLAEQEQSDDENSPRLSLPGDASSDEEGGADSGYRPIEEDDESAMFMHPPHIRNSSISCATVHIYRHCVRSTATKVKGAHYDDLAHYTDLPLPDWNAPMKWCTDQGAALIKNEGKKLRQREPKMDLSKLKVIVDTDQRVATSANSLLQGLAGQGEIFAPRVDYFPVLFNAFKPLAGASVCKTPSKQLEIAQKQQRLDTTPMPMGVGFAHDMNQTRYNEVLELFEKLFGVGAAGSLKQMTNPPIIDNQSGLLKGAPVVLKLLATNLMFAYASNITIATHVPVSRDQIFELGAWIHWQRRVTQIPAHFVPKKACGALSIIATLLGKPRQKHAIYVGHDSDQDALAHFFQITWKAPPFPVWKPTPPGSSLRFTSLGDSTALVHFTYQVFDSSDDPDVKVVPTLPGRVNLFEVKAFIEMQITDFAGEECLKVCTSLSANM
ncbi:ANKRD17 [Symbiodinium sp. CCMP2456]|nr:ANKRD17 [Symbiodinium sp. CCMP2456]